MSNLSIWEHCMQPDNILLVQRIGWTANAQRKAVQENGFAFFHVLIWMTWQQSRPNRLWENTAVVLGKSAEWHWSFPEKTFAAHSMSLPCRWGRGACESTAMSEEQTGFYMIKKILQLVLGKYMLSVLIWPRVLLLWLFTGPWLCFCAEETPAESWLPADRTNSLTPDGGPPNKTHGSTHILQRCEGCGCVSANCLCHRTHFCVCAPSSYWLIALRWELNLRKCGLTKEACRRMQTVVKSIPLIHP